MVAPHPEQETSQFLETLAEMIGNNFIDEAALRGIIARTQRLFSLGHIPQDTTYAVLSMAAFIEGDLGACVNYVDKRFAAGNQSAAACGNALTYYVNMGLVQETRQLAKAAAQRFPDDKTLLIRASICAATYKDIELAKELMAKLDLLIINDAHDPISPARKGIVATKKIIKNFNLSSDDIAARIEVAVQAVRAVGVSVRRTNVLTFQTGCFHVQFYVGQTQDECSELNFIISKKLCEKFTDTGIDLFAVECRPLIDVEVAA